MKTKTTATLDEALKLEQRFSKHNDSKSFRAAQAEKQKKRAHPVNENDDFKRGLIDVNALVDKTAGSARPGTGLMETGLINC